MLISEAFSAYETGYIVIKGYGVSCIQSYRRTGWSLVKALGDISISSVGVEEIYKWHDYIARGKCSNTIRNYVSCVRSVLKWLDLHKHKCLNYQLVPGRKREDVIMPYLTPKQVADMIDAAYSLRNRLVVSLLYSSGVRVSELISLNRGQIHDRRFTVRGKGKKVRLCFIDPRTEDLMLEYLGTRRDDSDALIVSNLFKERVTAGTIELIVKNTAKRAGINLHVTPHTLRHSFASDFTNNNGGAVHLQKLLGHANLATTMRYCHVANPELAEKYERFHSV